MASYQCLVLMLLFFGCDIEEPVEDAYYKEELVWKRKKGWLLEC